MTKRGHWATLFVLLIYYASIVAHASEPYRLHKHKKKGGGIRPDLPPDVKDINTGWGPRLSCSSIHNIYAKQSGSQDHCDQYRLSSGTDVMWNLPQITAAHCETDPSKPNICNVLAGRFEFVYNVTSDQVEGPVRASKYVYKSGMHERVPISYSPSGKVLTADRVINWARLEYGSNVQKLNLLNRTQFNWCKYAPKDNWPYKTGFKDYKSGGRFNVYFHNRQACVYDNITKDTQHFNTRFLHNSTLRLDLDYSPTIFPFRDPKNNDIRLIKHKRQHWYEVPYRVLNSSQLGGSGLKYFVSMSASEKLPSKVDGQSGPFIGRHAYRKFSDKCLSDFYQTRNGKNGQLLQILCGFDQAEIIDFPYHVREKVGVITVGLHQIPRWPYSHEKFYGVHVRDDDKWSTFAYDGIAFSAATTRPYHKGSEVFMLYAKYSASPSSSYDEYYPMTYMSRFVISNRNDIDENIRSRTDAEIAVKELNYVDDIAYTYDCKSILVIFGPLYTEMSLEQWNLQVKTPIRPIYDLGMYEPTNAFFVDYRNPHRLWALHRLNYITLYDLSCATKPDTVLTGIRRTENLFFVGSKIYFPVYYTIDWNSDFEMSEETFFMMMDVLKTRALTDDLKTAPDPKNYPYDKEAIPDVVYTDDTWLWYLAAAVATVLLILAIIGFLTMRRIRRHRRKGMGIFKTARSSVSKSSSLGGRSKRSNLSKSSSRSSKQGSVRSRLSMKGGSSSAMKRFSGSGSSNRGSASGGKTSRSDLAVKLSRSNPSITRRSSGSFKLLKFKDLTSSKKTAK